MFGLIGSNDPSVDLTSTLAGTGASMLVIATISVGLRLGGRRMARAPLKVDDWLIFAALPFVWGMCILLITSAAAGTPRIGQYSFWAHNDRTALFFKMLMPWLVCWVMGVSLAKLSMICFFRRIWRTRNTRIAAYTLYALIGMFMVASVPMFIFSCTPVHKYWFQWGPVGHCQNLFNQFLGTAVPNTIFDVAVFVFPIPLISALQLKRVHKIAISVIFVVAGFIIIISALRLVTVVQLQTSAVPTTALLPIAIFSTIEAAVSIFCACLPSFTPIVWSAINTMRQAFGLQTLVDSSATPPFQSQISSKEVVTAADADGNEYVVYQPRSLTPLRESVSDAAGSYYSGSARGGSVTGGGSAGRGRARVRSTALGMSRGDADSRSVIDASKEVVMEEFPEPVHLAPSRGPVGPTPTVVVTAATPAVRSPIVSRLLEKDGVETGRDMERDLERDLEKGMEQQQRSQQQQNQQHQTQHSQTQVSTRQKSTQQQQTTMTTTMMTNPDEIDPEVKKHLSGVLSGPVDLPVSISGEDLPVLVDAEEEDTASNPQDVATTPVDGEKKTVGSGSGNGTTVVSSTSTRTRTGVTPPPGIPELDTQDRLNWEPGAI